MIDVNPQIYDRNNFGTGIKTAAGPEPNQPASAQPTPPPASQQPQSPAQTPPPTSGKAPTQLSTPPQQTPAASTSPTPQATKPAEVEENELESALLKGLIERAKTLKIAENIYIRIYMKPGQAQPTPPAQPVSPGPAGPTQPSSQPPKAPTPSPPQSATPG